MKKVIVFFLIFSSSVQLFAAHIIGGEMYYYNRGAGSTPGTIKYEVVLKLYRDNTPGSNGAALDPSVNFGIYKTSNGSQYKVVTGIPLDGPYTINYTVNDPCFGFQGLYYQIGYYRTTIELPTDAQGYTVSFQ